jgi:hypothetical protein
MKKSEQVRRLVEVIDVLGSSMALVVASAFVQEHGGDVESLYREAHASLERLNDLRVSGGVNFIVKGD